MARKVSETKHGYVLGTGVALQTWCGRPLVGDDATSELSKVSCAACRMALRAFQRIYGLDKKKEEGREEA